MRIYTVHERASPPGSDPDVVLVKEGFCWPALLLPPVWLVWHRQWLGLVVYFVGALAVALLTELMTPVGGSALGFCYAVLVGASANDWRRARLSAQGYRLETVVAAGSLAEAEGRYLRERPEGRPEPPPRRAAMIRPYRNRESAPPLAPWLP